MERTIFLATTLLVVFIFIPFNVSASVIINEIMYDLEEGSDTGREWVEIFNKSDTAIDLTGWKFYENETNHGLTMVQGNITLPKNGYAIVADNPDKFLTDNPSYSGILFNSLFSLKNDGESIALKDSNLTIIDEVTYDSSWGANGDGRSLQRKDPNGNSNEPTNWGTGNPTPGTINNISEKPEEEEIEEEIPEEPEAPPIITGNQPPIADAGNNIIGFINQEINFDGSNSSDPDGDELAYSWNMGDGKLIEEKTFTYKYLYPGTYLVTLMVYDGRNYVSDTITVKIQSQEITINEFIPNPEGKDEENEWIEIYNGSNSIVDISGWQLDDEDGGSKPFVFPENTLIAPKNYLVFSRQITKIALNNDKDKVRLLLPEGVVFQEVFYEKPKQGMSSARTDQGFAWSVPTPGMANLASPELVEGIGGTPSTDSGQVTYQQPIKPETTKESSQDYSWYYQSDFEREIEGGYIVLSTEGLREEIAEEEPQASFAEATESKLATAKESFSKQSPVNLILIIVAIILGASAIGLSLTKFRKKFP